MKRPRWEKPCVRLDGVPRRVGRTTRSRCGHFNVCLICGALRPHHRADDVSRATSDDDDEGPGHWRAFRPVRQRVCDPHPRPYRIGQSPEVAVSRVRRHQEAWQHPKMRHCDIRERAQGRQAVCRPQEQGRADFYPPAGAPRKRSAAHPRLSRRGGQSLQRCVAIRASSSCGCSGR